MQNTDDNNDNNHLNVEHFGSYEWYMNPFILCCLICCACVVIFAIIGGAQEAMMGFGKARW